MADFKKEINVSERPIDIESPRELTMEEREAREAAEMKLEAQANTSEASSGSYHDQHWNPGFSNRFPWMGFGALVFVLFAAGACVLTLSLADGVSQRQWPKQVAPNVIVSVLNNAANLCFGLAISNGIAIAWWRRTLRGASIEQLNRSWKFSSSIKDVVLGAKYFNVIALAALTAKFTIIDGTLLQRSLSTEIRQDPLKYANFTGYANTTIPNTGRVFSRSAPPEILAQNFNDDLKIWALGAGVLPNIYSGCNGECYVPVAGAGFEFDCTEPNVTTINYGLSTMQATADSSNAPECSNATYAADNATCASIANDFSPPLFSVEFTSYYDDAGQANGPNYSYIIMNMLWTTANDEDGNGCPGTRYEQSCNLRPAVINYPVKIENLTSADVKTATPSMSLAIDERLQSAADFRGFNQSGRQQNYFEVLRYNDVHEDHISPAGEPTQIGGIAKGLSVYLGGNASISFGGKVGFQVTQTDNAPTYLTNDLGVQTGGGADAANKCGYQYGSPMDIPLLEGVAVAQLPQYQLPNIFGKINQIMFALALDISGEDDDADKPAGIFPRAGHVYENTVHYKIDSAYMWGGFASSIICVLLVIPVYWGYWQLGRAVTLGPFEIAAAFRAPNLHHEKNVPVDDLIKEVGERQVKFGQIVGGGDAGRIGIAEPEYVARIHPSAKASEIRKTWRVSRQQTGMSEK